MLTKTYHLCVTPKLNTLQKVVQLNSQFYLSSLAADLALGDSSYYGFLRSVCGNANVNKLLELIRICQCHREDRSGTLYLFIYLFIIRFIHTLNHSQ